MRILLLCSALVSSVVTATAAAPDRPRLNLYEWSAVAPVVVMGKSLGDNGRYHEIEVAEVLRGDELEPGRIRVNLRDANVHRNRDFHRSALRLTQGESYVLLLEPRNTPKKKALPTFDVARGIDGIRELPPEGAEALLTALRRLLGVQDLGDDRLVWSALGAMLEENHPLLIETALDQFLKFRRGEPEHLASLRPLMDHPSPGLRERAVKLVAQVLSDDPSPGAAPGLRDELIARARRDASAAVRVAAARALARFDDDAVFDVLTEIADDDPDQDVRYVAETLLYDRARRGGAAAEARAN